VEFDCYLSVTITFYLEDKLVIYFLHRKFTAVGPWTQENANKQDPRRTTTYRLVDTEEQKGSTSHILPPQFRATEHQVVTFALDWQPLYCTQVQIPEPHSAEMQEYQVWSIWSRSQHYYNRFPRSFLGPRPWALQPGIVVHT
jgi:hypothetical protein